MMGTIAKGFLFGACIAGILPSAVAQAQELKPLPIENSLQLSKFSDGVPFSVSPDGREVAFTLEQAIKKRSPRLARYGWISQTGAPSPLKGSHIWISNIAKGATRDLTPGEYTNWSPSWSPDGRYLAFNSDKDGEAHLWLWDKVSDKFRRLGDEVVASGFIFLGPHWTADGQSIVERVLPEGYGVEGFLNLLHGEETDTNSGVGETTPSVDVSEWHPAIHKEALPISPKDSTGFDPLLSDLAVIDIRTGTVHRILRNRKIYFYSVSPNGKTVAAMSFDGFATMSAAHSLWQLSVGLVQNDHPQIVRTALAWDLRPITWSPDSSSLAYTVVQDDGRNELAILSVVEGDKSFRVQLPRDFIRPVTFCFESCPWLWDRTGSDLYSVTSSEIWKVTLNGQLVSRLGNLHDDEFRELVSENDSQLWISDHGTSVMVLTRSVHSFVEQFLKFDLGTGQFHLVSRDAKVHHRWAYSITRVLANDIGLLYLASDSQHCEDLWETPLSTDIPHQVTRINPQLSQYTFGNEVLLDWRDVDGSQLRGALLLPAGYKTGHQYPLIAVVYGGEELSRWFNQWNPTFINPQLLASRGYAVLFPDAPLAAGTQMDDLAKTILPGIQRAIDLGIADPERLGVMGHSFGGYSTLALIEQTKEFKAAVDISGPTNLVNAYRKLGSAGGIASVEEGQASMGGSLWQYPLRFVENSPVFYFDRIETPLLIIHGALDSDIPVIDSDVAYESLRRLGKTELVYARYRGEEHVPSEWGYANQLDYLSRIIAWFNKHLETP